MKSSLLSRFVSLFLLVVIISQGCARTSVRVGEVNRLPASMQAVALQGAREADEFLQKDPKKFYKYHGLLKAPPIRAIAVWVAQKGLKIYIRQLPLDKDVRKRVFQNIESEKFSQFFVPFLMGMVDLYVAGKKAKKENFTKYVLENFPDRKGIPGLEHKLFAYDQKKKKKKEEKVLISKVEDDAIDSEDSDEILEKESTAETGKEDKSAQATIIASVITILDAIILHDENFTLATPPKRLDKTIDQAYPATAKLLESLIALSDDTSPAYPAIVAMASTHERVRGLTAALIDIIHYFAYKHYQMFAKRYERKTILETKLRAELEKNPSLLANKLLDQARSRKYGVQILVDGLQGTLMESLSIGKASSPFLTSVLKEKREREKNRPKKIPHTTLPDTQDDFFEHLMKKGGFSHPAYLPFFKNLYTKHGNGIARVGNTTTPSISARNVPIIQTGAPVEGVGGTNLVNMHYINRKEDRAYYFFGNDALLQAPIANKAGMRTLAERLPEMESLNCMGTFEAGYHWSIDPVMNITLGDATKDYGEILCLRELKRRAKNQLKLNELKERFYELVQKGEKRAGAKKRLLRKIADLENESLPQILTFFFPWPDHFAHYEGAVSDAIIGPSGELNRLDYWLTRLTKIYSDARSLERTIFTMAGDHGLTPVRYLLNPEKAVFGSMIAEGYEIKMNKISSDEGEGPKLTDPLNPPSLRGYDVVVASTAGGNYMVDFFLDQGSNWSRQPTHDDLTNYKLLSGKTVNMVDESLNRLDDTLDFMVMRDDQCDIHRADVRAIGMRQGKKVEAKVIRRGERLFYESQSDLLQVRELSPYSVSAHTDDEIRTHRDSVSRCVDLAVKSDVRTWCTEDEWRELTSYSPRPDSVVQLSHLYDTDMAGTVNLFPAPYIGYNSLVPGRHAGELFMEKDAFVGVWGESIRFPKRIGGAVNGSNAPTLYEYLSGKKSGGPKNGWGYRSLFEN